MNTADKKNTNPVQNKVMVQGSKQIKQGICTKEKQNKVGMEKQRGCLRNEERLEKFPQKQTPVTNMLQTKSKNPEQNLTGTLSKRVLPKEINTKHLRGSQKTNIK